MHSSSLSPVPPAPLLTGLGQALRWLRERQSRKQYRVAEDAGITKGMLSAYETGRQRPSLETLDKLLETLGCDLNDLHNALQIVNGRPEQMKGWREAIHGLPGASTTAGLALGPGRPGEHPTTWPAQHSPAPPAGDRAPGARPWDWPVPEPSEISASGKAATFEVHEPTRLYDILGLDRVRQAPLAAEEEEAFSQMLDGFHSLLRYWHRSLAALASPERSGRPTRGAAPAAPAAPGAAATLADRGATGVEAPARHEPQTGSASPPGTGAKTAKAAGGAIPSGGAPAGGGQQGESGQRTTSGPRKGTKAPPGRSGRA